MMRRASLVAIGAFVIGGLLLATAAAVLLGSGRLLHRADRFVLYPQGSVQGLRVGSAVRFKGVDVGSVRALQVDLDHLERPPEEVRISVEIEIFGDRLRSRREPLQLGRRETLRRLIDLGLRAQLETESLVTGLRYVALDLKPGTPVLLVGPPNARPPEIPTLPAIRERLQEDAAELLANLAAVDLPGLAQSVRALAEAATGLITRPELARAVARMDDLSRGLQAAITELRRTAVQLGPDGAIGQSLLETVRSTGAAATQGARTLSAFNRVLQPEGALSTGFGETLTELHDAARAVRRLADQLVRDPAAILRGGRP